MCLPQLVILYKYLQPSYFSGSYATYAVFLLQLNELVLPIYLDYVSRGYLRFYSIVSLSRVASLIVTGDKDCYG